MIIESKTVRMKKNQTRLRFLWILHFTITSIVLMRGMYENQGTRKYIPVAANKDSSDCSRVFVNVLATNSTDPNAITCCGGSNKEDNLSPLCQRRSKYTFFSGRLTKFPDAWLLPLFPMLLQWLFNCIQSKRICLSFGSGGGESSSSSMWMRRLGFYILVLNFRGFVLFLGANALEELIITSSSLSPTTGCFYDEMLKSHQSSCYGSQFDFSDHVVLYLAQILCIPLVETLHYILALKHDNITTRRPSSYTNDNNHNDKRLHHQPQHSSGTLHVLIMVSCLLYLYVITLMGIYKTTMYFHTPLEILVGYMISLSIQLPLAYLQCYPDGNNLSKAFGLSVTLNHND